MTAKEFRQRVREVYPKAVAGDLEAVEELARLKREKDQLCACGCGFILSAEKLKRSTRGNTQIYYDAFHFQNARRQSIPKVRIGGMKHIEGMITTREERLMKQLVAMCSAADILISNTSRTALERFDVGSIKQARDVLVDEVLAARLLLKEQLRESSHRSDVRHLRKKVLDGSG